MRRDGYSVQVIHYVCWNAFRMHCAAGTSGLKAVIAGEILARSCCKVKSGRLSVFLSVGHWDILSMDVKVCNNWLFSWMRPGKPWHHDLKRMRSSAISPDARAYQYVGPLYIHTARGYFKRRAESSKFKYKQRIISLTYVFVPLALKPRVRESLVQVKNGLVIPSSDLSIIFFMDLKPIRSIISRMSKDR